MKYLDEHGAWMNFWMIIGSKRIILMKTLVGWMYGWKWFQNSYDKWKLLDSYNFHVQLLSQKKVSRVKLKGATLKC
jgi:hypothetical protein